MGEVLPTRPARVTMASGDPQRRVNYGVMVTNNSGSKGGVAEGGAYPLSYGGGVQLQGGGGGGGMLAVRTACTCKLILTTAAAMLLSPKAQCAACHYSNVLL